jgi:alkylation response protein AidB-like acyl-CoA dehydrogenase
MVEGVYEDVLAFARATSLPDGRRVIDQEWVRVNLAKVHAGIEFLRLLNWKVVSAERLDPADASSAKVYGTEFFLEAHRLLMEIVGSTGALRRGSPGAALGGRLDRSFQGLLILTFGGGTNEVQRDLIALFGLGMPRTPRH